MIKSTVRIAKMNEGLNLELDDVLLEARSADMRQTPPHKSLREVT
jgi:hypothetical protein